jgi:hypothetical protein
VIVVLMKPAVADRGYRLISPGALE